MSGEKRSLTKSVRRYAQNFGDFKVILVLKKGLDQRRIDDVRERLQQLGLASESAQGFDQTLVIVAGDASTMPAHLFTQIEGVQKVINVSARCPLVLSTTVDVKLL